MEVKTFKKLPAEAKMIRAKVFMEEQGLQRKGYRKQTAKGGRERNRSFLNNKNI